MEGEALTHMYEVYESLYMCCEYMNIRIAKYFEDLNFGDNNRKKTRDEF
jgi:hypothetical protein